MTSPIRAYPNAYDVSNPDGWASPENVTGAADGNCTSRTTSGGRLLKLGVSGFDFSSLPDDAIIDTLAINIKGNNNGDGITTAEWFWIQRNSDGAQLGETGAYGSGSCAASYWKPFPNTIGAWLTVAELKGEQYIAWVEMDHAGLFTNTVWIDAVYIEVTYHLPPAAGAGAVGDGLTWVASILRRGFSLLKLACDKTLKQKQHYSNIRGVRKWGTQQKQQQV